MTPKDNRLVFPGNWAYSLNRWHDRVGVKHLRKADGSPACGSRYLYTEGFTPTLAGEPCCRKCLKIAFKNAKES
jgi:hypothetical protein